MWLFVASCDIMDCVYAKEDFKVFHRIPTHAPMSVFELAVLAESLRVAAGSYSSDSADLYELLEEVRQLISEQSGIPNPGSDVIYSLMKNARHAGRKPISIPQQLETQLRSLRKQGMTLQHISESLGLPYSRVQRICSRIRST